MAEVSLAEVSPVSNQSDRMAEVSPVSNQSERMVEVSLVENSDKEKKLKSCMKKTKKKM